jgi:hypothetical protein
MHPRGASDGRTDREAEGDRASSRGAMPFTRRFPTMGSAESGRRPPSSHQFSVPVGEGLELPIASRGEFPVALFRFPDGRLPTTRWTASSVGERAVPVGARIRAPDS